MDGATGEGALARRGGTVVEQVGAPWPLPERPGFLIRRLHQIHVSLFSERCGAFGVTPLQYSLLSLLADRGEADQTTLANAVALDRTTTTGALKRLAARGFVERSPALTDRRSQNCRPTPAGRALLSRMEDAARQAHDATLEPLSAEERATLIRLMKKITAGHQQRHDMDTLLTRHLGPAPVLRPRHQNSLHRSRCDVKK